jgi:SAM-dependent methyltransferase
MKNREAWRPGKYVMRKGRLVASADRRELGVSSRLITNIIAEAYDLHLRGHARGRLLDLGCGKVPLYAAYRDLVTENVCVDWANTAHKNPHLDLEWDITQRLPFADGAFDTIILSDVLEHVPEPQALWHEMARLLAPGGKVLMNVPFLYWIHEEPYDFYRYTEFALRRMAEAAGMRVVELFATGGLPEVATDMAAKVCARLPVVGTPAATFGQWLTWRMVHTRAGARLSRATRLRFPLGYFMVAEKPSEGGQPVAPPHGG